MSRPPEGKYVLSFGEIDRTQIALAGGKGASLGELSRVAGVQVPAGFCVTTDAFRRAVAEVPLIEDYLDRLALLDPDDRVTIASLSAEIREGIEAVSVPGDVVDAIAAELERLGADVAWAVRSSATAEDLPTASFAGQHDTYLNVAGESKILRRVSRCWGSLYGERAVTYRLRNGLDHRQVHMAVVVQQMVEPVAAGVVFTADPVTSNRKTVAVEATFGLGDALVSGRVEADVYKVRDGGIVHKANAPEEVPDAPRRQLPVLSDDQVMQLATLAREIEAHFGCPQDIEWCLDGSGFHIVQSRPITTLFPVPERDDSAYHVYVSVGHGQMMTDPMKPLGLSIWQLTALPPMYVAAGRLFVDVTDRLATPASRAALLELFGRGDPFMREALETVLEGGEVPAGGGEGAADQPPPMPAAPSSMGVATPAIDIDPAVVAELTARTQESIATLERDIETKRGTALLDFILEDIGELKRILSDPLSRQAIMAGIEATWWLNDKLQEWLGEKNAADVLTRSAPHNVTSEMGLDLLDVSDVIRPHSGVVEFLRQVTDDDFLDDERLTKLEGGMESRDALRAYLQRYGMRCVGEIDITRPRWSEQPRALIPVILGNIKSFEPGEARRLFERGERKAAEKEAELLGRLRLLPDGEEKADATKQMIDRLRTFIGFREYPKYGMISRYFIYKRALLREAERLLEAQVLADRQDIFFLTLEELREAVRTQCLDPELIAQRKEAFASYHRLRPPRVLTSEGEAIAGSYRRHDLPAGALAGLGVSAGTVEGRARVILDMAEAEVEEGDILVTAHTDPSWSPLFVAVKGLVTEVGGLMTHGAVVAREYGLPAVVGVEHATQLIADGQKIRLNGGDGYVELLEST